MQKQVEDNVESVWEKWQIAQCIEIFFVICALFFCNLHISFSIHFCCAAEKNFLRTVANFYTGNGKI